MRASERTAHNAVTLVFNPEFREICSETGNLDDESVIREAAIVACLSEGPEHVSSVRDVIKGVTRIIKGNREGDIENE